MGENNLSGSPVVRGDVPSLENPYRPRRPEELDWSQAETYRNVRGNKSPLTFVRALQVFERVQGQASISPPGTFWAVWEFETDYRKAQPFSESGFKSDWELVPPGDASPQEVAAAAVKAVPEDLLEQWTPKLSAYEGAEIRELFTYHAPTPDQQERLVKVRAAARHFAAVVISCAKACADRSAAMRKLREAVMTVNAAIVLEGTVSGPRPKD